MDTKKRERPEAAAEALPEKRLYRPASNALLHSLPLHPNSSTSTRGSHFEDILAGSTIPRSHDDPDADPAISPPQTAPIHAVSRTKTSLHQVTAKAIYKSSTAGSSLFQSANSLEIDETPSQSVSLSTLPDQFESLDTEHLFATIVEPSIADLVSNGGQEQNIKKASEQNKPPASLFQASASFLPRQSATNDAFDSLPSNPGQAANNDDEDDEFEAILAAAKLKRANQVPKQLHQPVLKKIPQVGAAVAPKQGNTTSLFAPLSSLPAIPASAPSLTAPGQIMDTATSLDFTSPSIAAASDEEDELEDFLKNVKKGRAQPPAPLRVTQSSGIVSSISSSLFTNAGAKNQGRPSSLFSSALHLDNSAPLFSPQSAAASSLSRPSPASTSSSLFMTASSLNNDPQPLQIESPTFSGNQNQMALDDDEDDELEAFFRQRKSAEPPKPLQKSAPAKQAPKPRIAPFVSPFKKKPETPVEKNQDDEVEEALRTLLEGNDDDDEEEVEKEPPKQNHLPPVTKSPFLSRRPLPSGTKPRSKLIEAESQSLATQDFTPSLMADHQALLEGIDFDDDLDTDASSSISTPHHLGPPSTGSKSKFYKASSKSPSTASQAASQGFLPSPSPSPLHHRSTNAKPMYRTTPYSTMATHSLPPVTTTPSSSTPSSHPDSSDYPQSPTRHFARSPLSPPLITPTKPISSDSRKSAVRAPFTSPSRLFGMSEEELAAQRQSLKKKKKQVNYGIDQEDDAEMEPGNESSAAKTNGRHRPRHKSLFNLHPSAEQLALRKPWKDMQRAPQRLDSSFLQKYRIRTDVINMTSDSAATYVFEQMDLASSTIRRIGADEMFEVMKREVLGDDYGAPNAQQGPSSTNQKKSKLLFDKEWIKNHYRWIVWKLASMERSFPHDFANVYLTAERTLAQLKYRYEREINEGNRSSLKKILEHDAASALHCVFVVSAVRYDAFSAPQRIMGHDDMLPNNDGSASSPNAFLSSLPPTALPPPNHSVIEISDGWYCVNALCDPYLSRLVHTGEIFQGQKIHVFGAVLVGNEAPSPPLETPPSTMLKLSINGVRRAKWHETLGFQIKNPLPSIRIASMKPGGGVAPKIEGIIMRVYPITFMEDVPWPDMDSDAEKEFRKQFGTAEPPTALRITRSARGEELAQARWAKRKENWIEKTMNTITSEVMKTRKANGEEAISFDGSLTQKQQEEVEQRLMEAMEPERHWIDREVRGVVKLLVCDFPGPEGHEAREVINYIATHGAEALLSMTSAQKKALQGLGKALISFYNFSEDALAQFQEGNKIVISYVNYRGEPITDDPSKKTSVQVQQRVMMDDDIYSGFQSPPPEAPSLPSTPLARLSTTNFSICEFPKVKADSNISKTLSSLFGRVATPFDALDARLRLRDVVLPAVDVYSPEELLTMERRKLIDRFTVINEFDGVGLLLFASTPTPALPSRPMLPEQVRHLKQEFNMDIFLTDPSGELLIVRIQSIQDNLPPSALLTNGSLLAFRNLQYDGYDTHVGAHVAVTSDVTEWLFKMGQLPALLAPRREEIYQWMNEDSFDDDMGLLASRIVDIRTGAASKAKPDADLTMAVFRQAS